MKSSYTDLVDRYIKEVDAAVEKKNKEIMETVMRLPFFRKDRFPPVLPAHLAVIMDGNGRWAANRGLPRSAGHKAGFDNFVRTVELCAGAGIGFLTVYAFSTENWNRSDDDCPRAAAHYERGHYRICAYAP